MYQSVGHELLPALATAMDLPLYRAPITGHARQHALYYTPTPEDEVEALYALLQEVLHNHPDVEAVATGAILSTYQRTRVESVYSNSKSRQLIPPQLLTAGPVVTGLPVATRSRLFVAGWNSWSAAVTLKEMISSGMEAILIKVASMGLSPEKHLGRTIKELLPELRRLVCAIQLFVDSFSARRMWAQYMWGRRRVRDIHLGQPFVQEADCNVKTVMESSQRLPSDESECINLSNDPFAPVAYLKIKSFHLEVKSVANLLKL